MNYEKVSQILQSLGLIDNEIKTYLALLKLGTATSSQISREAKMPRSTAQFSAHQLVEKELCLVIKKGNTYLFSIEDPEKLIYLIEQEEHKLEHKRDKLNMIMGDLKQLKNPYAHMPKVRYIEGAEGIKSLLRDVLEEKQTIFGVLREHKDIAKDLSDFQVEEYNPARIKHKIKSYFIFDDNKQSLEYRKKDKELNRISLIVPENIFPFENCMQIYGNKVAFYAMHKNDLTGILVTNDYIRKTQYSIFKMAWNFARQLPVNKKYKDVELPM